VKVTALPCSCSPCTGRTGQEGRGGWLGNVEAASKLPRPHVPLWCRCAGRPPPSPEGCPSMKRPPRDPPQTALGWPLGRPPVRRAPASRSRGPSMEVNGGRRRRRAAQRRNLAGWSGAGCRAESHLVKPCQRLRSSSCQKGVHLAAKGAAQAWATTSDRRPRARLSAGWQPLMIKYWSSCLQPKRSRDSVLGFIESHASECGLQLQRPGGAALVSARPIQPCRTTPSPHTLAAR
jgi:hypothetical protein